MDLQSIVILLGSVALIYGIITVLYKCIKNDNDD